MHAAMYALESQREMAEYYDNARAQDVVRAFYIALANDPQVPTIAAHFPPALSTFEDMEDTDIEARADKIRMSLAKQMRMADTYYVDNNMVTLVDGVYERMPSHPLTQESLPVPFGWMYLGRNTHVEIANWVALDDMDMHSVEQEMPPEAPGVHFRAMSWKRATQVTADGHYRPGYEIWFYLDRATVERQIKAGLDNPRWDPIMSRTIPPFAPVRSFFWADGQTAPDGADSMVDLLAAQWFQAAVVLMVQPISVRAVAPSNKGVDKRMARANMPIKLVTIITLRSRRNQKEGQDDPDHEGRTYSHQWLVDAHWRNQYYPSTGEHRVILIHGYTKGPEGAPLIIKQKVKAWVR